MNSCAFVRYAEPPACIFAAQICAGEPSHNLKQENTPDFHQVYFLGRRTESLTEPILQTLHSLLLHYDDIKGRLEKLHLLLRDFAYSERASQMDFLL